MHVNIKRHQTVVRAGKWVVIIASSCLEEKLVVLAHLYTV